MVCKEQLARINASLAEVFTDKNQARIEELVRLYDALTEEWTERAVSRPVSKVLYNERLRVHFERLAAVLDNNNWDAATYLRVQFERFEPPRCPYYPQLYSRMAVAAWRRWLATAARRCNYRMEDLAETTGARTFEELLKVACECGHRQYLVLTRARKDDPVDVYRLAQAAPAMLPGPFYLLNDAVVQAVRLGVIDAPPLRLLIAELDRRNAWPVLHGWRKAHGYYEPGDDDDANEEET